MSEEAATERVLAFSTNPGNALKSNSKVLAEQLTCHICSNLSLDPYVLRCGHTFCGACLSTWVKEKESSSTCPMCRVPIAEVPIYNKALRVILECIITSYNASQPETGKFELESRQKSYDKLFSLHLAHTKQPIYSEEDGMYMCAYCLHEVWDGGRCSHCEAFYPNMAEVRSSDDEVDDDSFEAHMDFLEPGSVGSESDSDFSDESHQRWMNEGDEDDEGNYCSDSSSEPGEEFGEDRRFHVRSLTGPDAPGDGERGFEYSGPIPIDDSDDSGDEDDINSGNGAHGTESDVIEID